MIREWFASHQKVVIPAALAGALVLTAVTFVAPLLGAVIAALGGWSVLLVAGVVNHWEGVEKWGGRLLGSASYFSGRAERVALSAEMQGLINGARKEMAGELPDVMPLPARIRFVRNERDLAELGEGEVVISLRDPRRHAENTARAALAYVSTAAVRPARPYVGRDVMTGVDYSLTKKILRCADVRALDYFLTDLWAPSVEGHPELQAICDAVEHIDEQGLLTRVLLEEFLDLGRRLWGQNPSPAVQAEAREFVDFLAHLVEKQPDERVELAFIRARLKVAAVLVGERERAEGLGAAPYVRATKVAMQTADAVYMLARGARCPLVHEVLRHVEGDDRVRAIDVTEYSVEITGNAVKAICARIAVDRSVSWRRRPGSTA